MIAIAFLSHRQHSCDRATRDTPVGAAARLDTSAARLDTSAAQRSAAQLVIEPIAADEVRIRSVGATVLIVSKVTNREEMFPSLVVREAYDANHAAQPGTKGDLEYLRILRLAASTRETNVAAALSLLQMVTKRSLSTRSTPCSRRCRRALTCRRSHQRQWTSPTATHCSGSGGMIVISPEAAVRLVADGSSMLRFMAGRQRDQTGHVSS